MDLRDQVADASRGFVPPFELAGSRPRDVQLTAGGRAVHVLAMFLFAAAIAVVVFLSRLSAQQAEDRDKFARSGVDTPAEITRLWHTSGDDKKYWVGYRYEADGRVFDRESRVSSSRWRKLETGQSLGVRFLRDAPERAVVTGSEPRVLPPWLAYIMGPMIATLAWLLLRTISCQRRLLAEGRPAPALVTGIEKHKTSHGGSYRYMKYSFQAMSGAVAKGKAQTSQKSQQIGSVICVVYDPDRPKKSRPYPFPLVKTARL